MLKTCIKCNMDKDLTEFYRHSGMSDGRLNVCKECKREYAREHTPEYYRKNKDVCCERTKRCYHKKIDQYRGYKRAAQLRRKALVGTITFEQIQTLLEEQNNKCYYCGKTLEKYHVDHKIPVSREGPSTIDNLCCACPSCNLSKNDQTEMEFKARNNF